jgi:hypothetical protein
MDSFENRDLSVCNVVDSLRYAFMAHCTARKASVLAFYRSRFVNPENDADYFMTWEEILPLLTHELLEEIRALPSFEMYLLINQCCARKQEPDV